MIETKGHMVKLLIYMHLFQMYFKEEVMQSMYFTNFIYFKKHVQK